MNGVAILAKSFGLDLSPEGIKNLMTEIGIDSKVNEAMGVITNVLTKIEERFDRIDKTLEENQLTLFTKLSAMHEDILDASPAGPHQIPVDAVLIEPETMLETHGLLRGNYDGTDSSTN